MLRAAVIDETPGMGITEIPFLRDSFTNIFPGSDNNGVPASDIKDKILPSLKYSMITEICFFSLNL